MQWVDPISRSNVLRYRLWIWYTGSIPSWWTIQLRLRSSIAGQSLYDSHIKKFQIDTGLPHHRSKSQTQEYHVHSSLANFWHAVRFKHLAGWRVSPVITIQTASIRNCDQQGLLFIISTNQISDSSLMSTVYSVGYPAICSVDRRYVDVLCYFDHGSGVPFHVLFYATKGCFQGTEISEGLITRVKLYPTLIKNLDEQILCCTMYRADTRIGKHCNSPRLDSRKNALSAIRFAECSKICTFSYVVFRICFRCYDDTRVRHNQRI
jgi:hypothetical protein